MYVEYVISCLVSLYNPKDVKNTLGGGLPLGKLQASAYGIKLREALHIQHT